MDYLLLIDVDGNKPFGCIVNFQIFMVTFEMFWHFAQFLYCQRRQQIVEDEKLWK